MYRNYMINFGWYQEMWYDTIDEAIHGALETGFVLKQDSVNHEVRIEYGTPDHTIPVAFWSVIGGLRYYDRPGTLDGIGTVNR
jgi:hypothetical protein